MERLTFYRMLPEMGPPETTSWEFPFDDRSWDREIQHFVDCAHTGEPVLGSVHDAMAALSIVQDVYRQSGTL